MFSTVEEAINGTIRFAGALGIKPTSNEPAKQVTPVIDAAGEKKYTKEDNNCKFCSTWCCNNKKGTKLGCVMFNPDLDIKCYPAQQQRFVRSGRAYLKENPSCDSLKEQRFGAIRVVYACEMAPWKKVLGFKISVNEANVPRGGRRRRRPPDIPPTNFWGGGIQLELFPLGSQNQITTGGWRRRQVAVGAPSPPA